MALRLTAENNNRRENPLPGNLPSSSYQDTDTSLAPHPIPPDGQRGDKKQERDMTNNPQFRQILGIQTETIRIRRECNLDTHNTPPCHLYGEACRDVY